jgi:hypothetical protein
MFIPSSRTVLVALPALAASIGTPAAAFGQITINSGAVNVFANGTVGCQGSTSGNNVDDPAEVTGTSGQLTSGASTGGGPVAPGDLPTLPGCPASFTAASAAAELIEGTGSYRRIQQDLSMATQIINMGGNLCSHGANAVGYTRVSFTVTQPTPYTLSGNAAFDDEDASGMIRFGTVFFAIHFVTRAQNGDFLFSGTLNPGTYSLNSNAAIAASFSNTTGNFAETGAYTAILTLGTPPGPTCDSIDFNNDGALFDPTDIDAFLSVFAEGPCIPETATCSDIDFNNDGALFDPCDIDSFLLAFAEGPCTLCGI